MQVRLDVAEIDDKLIVLGLNGGSIEVSSLKEFRRAYGEHGLATTLYVYTLAPLVKNAPHWPLFAWCHDGSKATFTMQKILDFWHKLWMVCLFPHILEYEQTLVIWIDLLVPHMHVL